MLNRSHMHGILHGSTSPQPAVDPGRPDLGVCTSLFEASYLLIMSWPSRIYRRRAYPLQITSRIQQPTLEHARGRNARSTRRRTFVRPEKQRGGEQTTTPIRK